MSILVVAEHDNSELKPATRVALAAAAAIGGDVDVLVAGAGVDGVASEAAAVGGVNKVLVADNAVYANQLPENLAALVVDTASGYSHILCAHTTNGKNFMPIHCSGDLWRDSASGGHERFENHCCHQ